MEAVSYKRAHCRFQLTAPAHWAREMWKIGPMTNGEFTQTTKDLLAAEAGHRCSAPWCAKTTSAASSSRRSGVSNTGEAAHIRGRTEPTARYDASMTDVQRAEPGNGLWLCEYDAKLIDNDAIRYPIALLKQWKAQRIVIAQFEQEQGAGASPAAILAHQLSLQASSPAQAPTTEVERFLEASGVSRAWGRDTLDYTVTLLSELGLNALLHANATELHIRSGPGEVELSYVEGSSPFGMNEFEAVAPGRGGRTMLAIWHEDWNERYFLTSRLQDAVRYWTVRELAVVPPPDTPCVAAITRPRELDLAAFVNCEVPHIVLMQRLIFSDMPQLFAQIKQLLASGSVLVTTPVEHNLDVLRQWHSRHPGPYKLHFWKDAARFTPDVSSP